MKKINYSKSQWLTFTIVLSLVIVQLSCTKFSSSMEKNPEEDLIRAARAISNRAIEKKDVDSLASIWASDYHVITSRNSEVSGRVANRERFANEFNSKPDVLYVRTPDVFQVFSQWNMASETGHWVGHWTENGKLIELTGTYLAKWHKVKGSWQIRAEIFVPLTCSGGEYCDRSPL
jgi:ketosteroid isomerase-like protein